MTTDAIGDFTKQAIGNGTPIAAGVLGYSRPLLGVYPALISSGNERSLTLFEAARLVGVVLTAGGTYGYFAPTDSAKVFGIPFADTTTSLSLPGIGGRNAAAGLAPVTLTVLAAGQHTGDQAATAYEKALEVLLACWTLPGFSDTC